MLASLRAGAFRIPAATLTLLVAAQCVAEGFPSPEPLFFWLLCLAIHLTGAAILFAVFRWGYRATHGWRWPTAIVALLVVGVSGLRAILPARAPLVHKLPIICQFGFCLLYVLLILWQRGDERLIPPAPPR
jgi:hypothetical protein